MNESQKTCVHYLCENGTAHKKEQLQVLRQFMGDKVFKTCVASESKHGETPLLLLCLEGTFTKGTMDAELLQLLSIDTEAFWMAHNTWAYGTGNGYLHSRHLAVSDLKAIITHIANIHAGDAGDDKQLLQRVLSMRNKEQHTVCDALKARRMDETFGFNDQEWTDLSDFLSTNFDLHL